MGKREEIMKVISYSADTGEFIWLKPTSNRVREGAQAGCVNSNGYVVVSVLGRRWRGHRLAWFIATGEEPKGLIDHINGNRRDNRLANLRLADHSQNAANSLAHRDNKLKLKGVHEHHDGRYRAQIARLGKRIHLGVFETAEEAHAAYAAAAQTAFGDFACDGGENRKA